MVAPSPSCRFTGTCPTRSFVARPRGCVQFPSVGALGTWIRLRFIVCGRPECRQVFFNLRQVRSAGTGYCSGGCRHTARTESVRQAGRRYQASRDGRFGHATRQQRQREKVTHQRPREFVFSVQVDLPLTTGGKEDADGRPDLGGNSTHGDQRHECWPRRGAARRCSRRCWPPTPGTSGRCRRCSRRWLCGRAGRSTLCSLRAMGTVRAVTSLCPDLAAEHVHTPLYTLEVVEDRRRRPPRRSDRIDGLGDFRDLRQLMLFEGSAMIEEGGGRPHPTALLRRALEGGDERGGAWRPPRRRPPRDRRGPLRHRCAPHPGLAPRPVQGLRGRDAGPPPAAARHAAARDAPGSRVPRLGSPAPPVRGHGASRRARGGVLAACARCPASRARWTGGTSAS